ncbi:MAG TPA: lysophospholipid acyltransferase family protein [Candidatus Competibacteraceae bacterium]|nr:lysophospholipid acyltransferase family protein [Candidatus Competibacteraceae bacterium]
MSAISLDRPRPSAGLFIRGLLFSLGMILATVLWGPVVLLSFPLSLHRRYWIATRWAAFVLWWLRITCGIRHRIRGLENLPPGPAIILAKHQSTWETLLLPLLFRPLAIVLKRELLWVPVFGWALALIKPVAIDRSSGKAALRQVIERGQVHLRTGQWVLLFPEGTRTAPGTRRRYHIGGAALAAESGYPIVPVAHNAGLFWPRRSFFKRPGTVEVVIGPVIDSHGRSPHELLAAAEDWIEQTVAEISGLPVPPLAKH